MVGSTYSIPILLLLLTCWHLNVKKNHKKRISPAQSQYRNMACWNAQGFLHTPKSTNAALALV